MLKSKAYMSQTITAPVFKKYQVSLKMYYNTESIDKDFKI